MFVNGPLVSADRVRNNVAKISRRRGKSARQGAVRNPYVVNLCLGRHSQHIKRGHIPVSPPVSRRRSPVRWVAINDPVSEGEGNFGWQDRTVLGCYTAVNNS